jgi:hypothetical protein
MKHSTVIEKIYEAGELSALTRLRIAFHLACCKECAQAAGRYAYAQDILRRDFFADGADGKEESVADYVMSMISKEETASAHDAAELPPEILSIRNWIISGVIIIASLTASFFGMDFGSLVKDFGGGFTIPLAITIGIVITAYGAVFIGNHLKELSKRFGLPARD